jgi:hypothetical protein
VTYRCTHDGSRASCSKSTSQSAPRPGCVGEISTVPAPRGRVVSCAAGWNSASMLVFAPTVNE